MKKIHKKFLSALLAVLLLLPTLLVSVYAQEADHKEEDQIVTAAIKPLVCQHVCNIARTNEYRYISETHHSCYEVEIRYCTKCDYTVKTDLFILCTEEHELGVVESYTIDENGEFIYYGICADCKEHVHTFP